jgi:hypothetical protein
MASIRVQAAPFNSCNYVAAFGDRQELAQIRKLFANDPCGVFQCPRNYPEH